jgi:hypothetical protein
MKYALFIAASLAGCEGYAIMVNNMVKSFKWFV